MTIQSQGLLLRSLSFAILCLLWVTMMSVTLVESDAYRYSAIMLIVFGMVTLPDPGSFLKDRLSVLCMAAGAYAFLRFAVDVLVFKEKGASEWLYGFPLLFPLLGLALYKTWELIPRIVLAFFAIALALLAASTQWSVIISGERAYPLFHHNPIHGAVGCGFLFIGAFYWAMHYVEQSASKSTTRLIFLIAFAVMLFSVVNIYGSKSKGVWLAMAPVLLSTLFFCVGRRQTKAFKYILGLVAGAFAIGFLAVSDNLRVVAGSTISTLLAIGAQLFSGREISGTLDAAIASQTTPGSLNERLQLWSNALEVIHHSPVWGSGAGWLTLWKAAPYQTVHYTLLHNGYLEILVRHGVLGLSLYTVILLMMLRRLLDAKRRGAISSSTLVCAITFVVYFCITIFTNSNNRLALGESFVLLFSAFTFAATWREHVRNLNQKTSTCINMDDIAKPHEVRA